METMKNKAATPEIVFRKGKPVAVILDIQHYRELLERAEDVEDLRALEAMRRKPLKFRRLEEFLAGYSPDV